MLKFNPRVNRSFCCGDSIDTEFKHSPWQGVPNTTRTLHRRAGLMHITGVCSCSMKQLSGSAFCGNNCNPEINPDFSRILKKIFFYSLTNTSLLTYACLKVSVTDRITLHECFWFGEGWFAFLPGKSSTCNQKSCTYPNRKTCSIFVLY